MEVVSEVGGYYVGLSPTGVPAKETEEFGREKGSCSLLGAEEKWFAFCVWPPYFVGSGHCKLAHRDTLPPVVVMLLANVPQFPFLFLSPSWFWLLVTTAQLSQLSLLPSVLTPFLSPSFLVSISFKITLVFCSLIALFGSLLGIHRFWKWSRLFPCSDPVILSREPFSSSVPALDMMWFEPGSDPAVLSREPFSSSVPAPDMILFEPHCCPGLLGCWERERHGHEEERKHWGLNVMVANGELMGFGEWRGNVDLKSWNFEILKCFTSASLCSFLSDADSISAQTHMKGWSHMYLSSSLLPIVIKYSVLERAL